MARRNGKSIACGVFGIALLVGVSGPALAQLAPGQIDEVATAVGLPVDEAVLALRALFSANVPQVIALAEEATRQAPPLCEQIMTEATRAAPDQIGELAAAIIALAPDCEDQVAAILAEGVAPAAGPLTATGPVPDPITGPSATAENPATDAPAAISTPSDTAESPASAVASPTTL